MQRLIPILLLLVTACDWPIHGQGGNEDIVRRLRVQEPGATDIALRLTDARNALDKLKLEGGEKYLPARLRKAEILWMRAARESAGELSDDAKRDLDALAEDLAFIARRLDEMQQSENHSKAIDQ